MSDLEDYAPATKAFRENGWDAVRSHIHLEKMFSEEGYAVTIPPDSQVSNFNIVYFMIEQGNFIGSAYWAFYDFEPSQLIFQDERDATLFKILGGG